MDTSEHARWQGRYGISDYLFGKAPNYFLASCKPLLPKSGKALAVADGEARNGVWLAEQGLDVVSIDFSEAAQTKAATLAKERGVAIKEVLAWQIVEAMKAQKLSRKRLAERMKTSRSQIRCRHAAGDSYCR